MSWRGAYSTLSTSESPSDGGVSSLLRDVLETADTPGQRERLQKYSLSSKACVGILRRAQRRSRKLPPALDSALRRVPLENLDMAIQDLSTPLGVVVQEAETTAELLFYEATRPMR